jgi:hypothetical protein
MRRSSSSVPRTLVWVAVVLLFILHHDFWFWDDRSLVLGFLPVGLFYHIAFSIAASLTWLCAVKFAWPAEIEDWAAVNDAAAPATASVPPEHPRP